jgi:hypothetical protein
MSTELERDNSQEEQSIDSLLESTLYHKKILAKTRRFQKLFAFIQERLPSKPTISFQSVAPEILAQQEQAQQFLDNKMYDAYSKMIGYGYNPPASQAKVFDDYAKNLLHHYLYNRDESDLVEIEKYLNNNYSFDKKELFEYILRTESTAYDHMLSKFQPRERDGFYHVKEIIDNLNNSDREYTNLEKELRKVLLDSDFSTDFFKYCISASKRTLNGYSGGKLYSIHNNLVELYKIDANLFLKDISFDEMMKFVKFNHECFDIINEAYHHSSNSGYASYSFEKWSKKEMPALIESYYSSDMEKRLQQTKNTFRGDLENMALRQARQSIEHQSVKTLPKEVKEKIAQIESIYWNLKNSHKTGENPQLDFDIQNLFEKRIPEVLEKYIRIPEEYRAKAQHETTGKTAYEMMMESLNNYQEKLQGLLDEKIQNNLSDMNATKIYSKKIM